MTVPELPEVETVRQGLEPFVTGRRITGVRTLHPRPVRRHLAGPDDFANRLIGRRMLAARRRGKFLWLPLDSGDALVAHLGMSGQFRIKTAGDTFEPHCRVVIDTDSGDQIRFVDQRMFGGLWWAEGGAELPGDLRHIGRDLFDPEFDMAAAVRAIRRRRTTIKRALLDQQVTSGIGNIYADEALWRAKLHYDRPTDRLTTAQVRGVLEAARDVMSGALAAGGTSFDALYVRVNGESGYFDRALQVYGREGEPCDRCGYPIVREAFMNRSSFRCRRCQPRPSAPRSSTT